MSDRFILEKQGHVMWLRFNRPEHVSGRVILLYKQGAPRKCWREWEGKPVGRISAA